MTARGARKVALKAIKRFEIDLKKRLMDVHCAQNGRGAAEKGRFLSRSDTFRSIVIVYPSIRNGATLDCRRRAKTCIALLRSSKIGAAGLSPFASRLKAL